MPISLLFARFRHYPYETLVFILIFASLFAGGIWSEHHISLIGTAFLEESLDELTPGDYEIRFVNDRLFHQDTEATIAELFDGVSYNLHKLQRTAGLTCGVERNCHQAFAMRDPDRYIRVIEGHFPDDTGVNTEVQALVTSEIADAMGFIPGSTFIFSSNQGNPIRVEISGIFEPLDAESAYWDLNDILLTGINTPVGGGERYDYGFMVTDTVFDAVFEPASRIFRGSVYSWLIETEPVAPFLPDVVQRRDTLQTLEQTFFQQNPVGRFVSRSVSELDTISSNIRGTIDQLRVLYGLMVLLIAGYGAYLHHWGVLHQIEWLRIPEMGVQASRVLQIRLQMLALLGLAGTLAGGIAGLLLWDFPFLLGIAYGLLAVLVGFVMIAVAGQSTRPGEKIAGKLSFIFDAQLDVLLLLVGLFLMVRLFALSTAGISAVIRTILTNPSQAFALIDPSLAHAPQNLLIPFIFAGGFLVLFLRIVLRVVRPDSQDSVSLMVLIGLTVMCGVAMTMIALRLDRSQHQIATQQTGGAARILLEADSDFQLPEDSGVYAGLVRVEDRHNSGNIITLTGLDLPQFNMAFPDYASELNALDEAEAIPLPGYLLPDDSVSLSLDVYSLPENLPDDPVELEVQIGLHLLDNRGVASALLLSPVSDPVAEEFVRYQADLPETDHAPYRLNGFIVDVNRSDEVTFTHTFFFDSLTLYREGDVVEVLQDFEAEGLPDDWDIQTGIQFNIITHLRFASPAQGEGSLRSTIRILNGRAVTIPFGIVPPDYVPVIASRQFVEDVLRETEDVRAVIGDNQQIELNLSPGVYTLRYQVVDVLESFPVDGGRSFLIMPQDTLLFFLNSHSDLYGTYDVSEIWLNEPGDAISDTIRSQLPETTWYLDDIYQQMKTEPYPATMITVLRFVFVMSLMIALLIVLTHATQWKQLLIILPLAVCAGLIAGVILNLIFPIFSIV